MAQASTTVVQIRQGVTSLLTALETVPSLNNKYVDLGGQDFVKQYLNDEAGQPVTDITVDEFVTGIANLQELLTWLDAGHRSALRKLSI